MIVKQYIKDFEALGFGMFVHFGIYSMVGRGEWSKKNLGMSWDEYLKNLKDFNPKPDWAKELVSAAKGAGCKYITLTTRHHDGFSLYDTCGLNDFDAPHTCGRDLIKEFVDACRAEDVIPFFYHTLLDWHEGNYTNNFPEYLKYLRKSVEILCTNYGKIGGLWFDGMWDKPNEDWEEDTLYSMIRSHQPEAMIINNTGLSERGALGHIELDSVTFERGRPSPINLADSPKYIASEMCEVFADHWGYAEKDYNYKSPRELIESLAVCRRYNSNLLLNVGPKGDGSLRLIDKGILELMGEWVAPNEAAIRGCAPTDIAIENKPKDFILRKGDTYYLFVHDLYMTADLNVALKTEMDLLEAFRFAPKIQSVAWLDNGEELEFTQVKDKVEITTKPFTYGDSYVVRVAEIKTV